MAIGLAIAAGLLGLSIIIRIVRFTLTLVLVGVLFDLLGGHGTITLSQLVHQL
jgi:hypothetical protein